jgi:8-oxo-dGTP diphosphatase
MHFHYLARGILHKNGKVLLVHAAEADHTFLPGGHIEAGEGAEKALLREFKEELGWDARITRFVGAVEYLWKGFGDDNHEINLLFEVEVPGVDVTVNPASCEPNLDFRWATTDELDKHNLGPESVRECLRTWDKNYRGFWGKIKE